MPSNRYARARQSARAKVVETIEKFTQRVRSDTGKWKLSAEQQTILDCLLVKRLQGRAVLSNWRVRKVASYAFIDAMLEHWRNDPERPLYFVTLCWDDGVSWEREPSFDVDFLVNKAQDHLRRRGLDGVGVLEFDAWKNIVGEPGRRMVGHAHFVGWAKRGTEFKPRGVEKALCASAALTNTLGAAPVVIKTIGLKPNDIAHLAYYMLKAPAYAKNPKFDAETGMKLFGAEHAQGSAARLFEVLTHLELGDVLFSIGSGKRIAARVREAVAESVTAGRGNLPTPSRSQISEFWRDARKENGSKKFREPRIKTRYLRRVGRFN